MDAAVIVVMEKNSNGSPANDWWIYYFLNSSIDYFDHNKSENGEINAHNFSDHNMTP